MDDRFFAYVDHCRETLSQLARVLSRLPGEPQDHLDWLDENLELLVADAWKDTGGDQSKVGAALVSCAIRYYRRQALEWVASRRKRDHHESPRRTASKSNLVPLKSVMKDLKGAIR